MSTINSAFAGTLAVWPVPPPTVILQPVSVSVTEGENIVMTADFAVTGSPIYQWQEFLVGGAWLSISGQTTKTLTTPSVLANTGALYRCGCQNDFDGLVWTDGLASATVVASLPTALLGRGTSLGYPPFTAADVDLFILSIAGSGAPVVTFDAATESIVLTSSVSGNSAGIDVSLLPGYVEGVVNVLIASGASADTITCRGLGNNMNLIPTSSFSHVELPADSELSHSWDSSTGIGAPACAEEFISRGVGAHIIAGLVITHEELPFTTTNTMVVGTDGALIRGFGGGTDGTMNPLTAPIVDVDFSHFYQFTDNTTVQLNWSDSGLPWNGISWKKADGTIIETVYADWAWNNVGGWQWIAAPVECFGNAGDTVLINIT